MTHDCRLGWHHAAQLIADRMPASFNPNAPRLVRVPLRENARALDVDPAPKPFFGFDLAAMPEPDRKMGEMAKHAQELIQELCGVNGAALVGFKQEAPAAALKVGDRVSVNASVGNIFIGDTGTIKELQAWKDLAIVNIDRLEQGIYLKECRLSLLPKEPA